MRAHLWKILLVLLLVLGIVGYFRYYWVFGTGAKAGELNYMVHKGVLFKTYEGKMIQTGIRTQSGSFQSLEFCSRWRIQRWPGCSWRTVATSSTCTTGNSLVRCLGAA